MELETGTVAAVYGRLATVETAGGLLPCTALGSLLGEMGALAVGDRVRVERSGDAGIIRGIEPRDNVLTRPPAHASKPPRIVAANLDLLVVLATLIEPPFNLGLVDRYLAAAAFRRIPVALCINKIDQLRPGPEEDPFTPYRALGLTVLEVSARTGEGLARLADLVRGRDFVLAGPSGVGKSSLAHALVPGLEVRIQEVNAITGKGRHTTSTSTRVAFPGGGHLVDTPGVRSFGLEGIPPEKLRELWPEFAPYARKCRFTDCLHEEEEGCAVEKAADRGKVDAGRLDRYRAILASVREGLG
ncbi:ribosome small subunit-dependent GTPase A [Myxococcota bacterium]|nr:ribosome small subunit-dependent GTPase A [Myxococcota bacterium]